MQWLQVLGQPFLAREKRKETDRQADSHQGRVLRLALGLLSQTVEPTLKSGQIGHLEYGGWGSPYPACFPCKPNSCLCVDSGPPKW